LKEVIMEKLWNIVALPYLLLFEWLRDRRWKAPQAPADGIRRHDGTGRAWESESSRLDALRTLAGEMRYCGHRHTGQVCTHAAEPPSTADALAAYGEQCGKHSAAGAPYRWVPAGWTPPAGQRLLAARLDDTTAITARQMHDTFAGAR
jgi:hypothetical protein